MAAEARRNNSVIQQAHREEYQVTQKRHRDWRAWGMYPGRRYYAIGLGVPKEEAGGQIFHYHYFTTAAGQNVMFVFSTQRKAKQFIRRNLEENPEAYLDLLEDTRGELPSGQREGMYTLVAHTPDELAETAADMGLHGLVLDPKPGENHPIPLQQSRGETGLDPDKEYYVLRFAQGKEAGDFYHYVNYRGEKVLPMFTSPKRMTKFVEEHEWANEGYLNSLRQHAADNPLTPRLPVAGRLLKDESEEVRGGQLRPVVETLAIIIDALDARYVVVDPGKPDGHYLPLPAKG